MILKLFAKLFGRRRWLASPNGKPPLLVFVTPANSQVFNLGSTDSDPGTPGFQANVQLTTNDNSTDVTLKVAGQTIDHFRPPSPVGSGAPESLCRSDDRAAPALD